MSAMRHPWWRRISFYCDSPRSGYEHISDGLSVESPIPIADPGVLRQDCFRFRATRLATLIRLREAAHRRSAPGGWRVPALESGLVFPLRYTTREGWRPHVGAYCCPHGEAVRRQVGTRARRLLGSIFLRAAHATIPAITGASERSIIRQTGRRPVQMVRRDIWDGNLFRGTARANWA
jgi:hypothetical protein